MSTPHSCSVPEFLTRSVRQLEEAAGTSQSGSICRWRDPAALTLTPNQEAVQHAPFLSAIRL